MRQRLQPWLLSGLLAAATAACGADDAEQHDDGPAADVETLDAYLLTTMELSPTHRLEVYEVAPGDFVFGETTGPDDSEIELDVERVESLSALYQRLMRGGPVPEEIERASLRQSVLFSATRGLASVEPASEARYGRAAEFGSLPNHNKEAPREVRDWRVNECRNEGEKDVTTGIVTVDASVCQTERTGDSWAYVNHVHAAQSKVRSYRGTITAKFRHDFGSGWVVDKTVNVTEGNTSRYWRYHSTQRFKQQLDISNASGDGWHLSVFGSSSNHPVVLGCYDGGYHCGIWSHTL